MIIGWSASPADVTVPAQRYYGFLLRMVLSGTSQSLEMTAQLSVKVKSCNNIERDGLLSYIFNIKEAGTGLSSQFKKNTLPGIDINYKASTGQSANNSIIQHN